MSINNKVTCCIEESDDDENTDSDTTKGRRNQAHAVRNKIIKFSKKSTSENVLESLQTCHWQDNLQVLQEKMILLNNPRRKEIIRGLQAVLQEMLIEEPFDGPNPRIVGFIPFDEGFEMYMGFQSVQNLSEQARYDFQCAVLHPKTGLCANIVKFPSSGKK